MHKRTLAILILLVLFVILFVQSKIYANIFGADNDHRHWSIQTGKASWYSEESPGIHKYTANNEIFDDTGLTAAMWDVPFNQRVNVTNLENGKSVVVRINDRGPHKRYLRKGRIIDLSKRAFSDIAPLKKGLIPIRLELLWPSSPL